ncbi:radical SAM protein [Patescibacteria group bacterium]|nr:radical SAM protein [Patescibacteria group bacterium]MBU4056393.1 radical SAM protein [Patescibacteria group bacterium]MBU4368202.1 radical SAM protein [Patescibacteria group bacterium]
MVVTSKIIHNIKTLRLLITDRCPYRCFYCHREGMKEIFPELLNVADYRYFMNLLKNHFGLKEVILSGGDPCCRSDIWEIVKSIKETGLFSIIITKGMLLDKLGAVNQITFTIDTLDKNLYSKITGVEGENLKKTVFKLIEAKSKGVKIVINTPISRNINDDRKNFEELLSFCQKHKVDEWKLIEEMNTHKKIYREDLYLEKYAQKMGIIKRLKRINGYKLSLNHHGVLITLYRCHCHAVKLLKRYIQESLFLDPAGNILLCMRNNRKVKLTDLIKKKNTGSIIETINNIDFEKICPIIKSK